jgi:hypothetical protein
MTTILTETSTFTATVAAPADADPANSATFTTGLQSLTNRTLYLNNQRISHAASIAAVEGDILAMQCWAEYIPTSSSWTTASKLDLTEVNDPLNVFSESAGDITVPTAGWWRVSGVLRATSGSPVAVQTFTIRRATTDQFPSRVGPLTGSGTDIFDGVFNGVISISDPATEKINLYQASGSTIDVSISPTKFSLISVQYMGPL